MNRMQKIVSIHPAPGLMLLFCVVWGLCADKACTETTRLPAPILEPNEVRIQPTELLKPAGLVLKTGDYPRTNGSTSAEPLGVWIACRLLGQKCYMGGDMFYNERRLKPLKPGSKDEQPIHEWIDHELYEKIRHRGTHEAYNLLINGGVDLIYECRLPSEDETALMKQEGVELDIRPIALDAFVFLHNKENPVTSLTLEQIRDIYTPGEDKKGRIWNWRQVGGPDLEIRPYLRNRNSGSQETMLSLVMKERPVLEVKAMMIGESMMGPYNRLNDDKSGIGYTFFYYERYMSPQKPTVTGEKQENPVSMFAIDGVMPSRETIADRSYPLVTDVYIATRKDLDPAHPAAKLRDWLMTEEGQRIVGESGYVPIFRSALKK